MLCRPEKDCTLALYISVTNQGVSSVLILEFEEDKKHIYFVSKVLHEAEIQYSTL